MTLSDGIKFKADANGGAASIAGQATLVAGSVTVNTTSVETGSIIMVSYVGTGLTNTGALSTNTIVNGTSFDIESTNGSDTNVVNWFIVSNN